MGAEVAVAAAVIGGLATAEISRREKKEATQEAKKREKAQRVLEADLAAKEKNRQETESARQARRRQLAGGSPTGGDPNVFTSPRGIAALGRAPGGRLIGGAA